MTDYTISEVAQISGVTKDTLRYYESVGLVDAPPRTDGGHRLYPALTVERLRFIKRAQELGFTLKETAALLLLSNQTSVNSSSVKDLAEKKIIEVDAEIANLKQLRKALNGLLCQCNGTGVECPIIESLTTNS